MIVSLLISWLSYSILAFSGLSGKDCKVNLDNIAGSYDGDCKKGLAEGTGTARGVDTYSGEFKKGLPHGLGRYIWQNGNFYSGGFANGQKDGYGELMIKRAGKKDSLVAGYWTKDVYIGSASVAYIVRHQQNIKGITFEQKSETGNEIIIVFQQDKKPIAADGLRLVNAQNVKAASEFDYSVLRKIEFPFLGTRLDFRSKGAGGVSIRECSAEFDIFEKGKWLVTVEVE